MAINLDFNFGITPVSDPELSIRDIQMGILRLDKIHPVISGNKWFKLKAYIAAYQSGAYKGIITFGGAYSNHLVAAAAACNYYQIPLTGFVRGTEWAKEPNTSLQECIRRGAALKYLSRAEYKTKDSIDFLQKLHEIYPKHLIIPEGGYGPMGIAGAQEICHYIPLSTDIIC